MSNRKHFANRRTRSATSQPQGTLHKFMPEGRMGFFVKAALVVGAIATVGAGAHVSGISNNIQTARRTATETAKAMCYEQVKPNNTVWAIEDKIAGKTGKDIRDVDVAIRHTEGNVGKDLNKIPVGYPLTMPAGLCELNSDAKPIDSLPKQ